MARADVFAAALRALDRGRGVAIASVIGVAGSTPRHLGARMAVADDGEQWGTIGGGRIEQLVVEAAREVAGGAAPRVVRQHLTRDLAMCCGGSMAIVLTPADRGALEQIASGAACVLVTPIEGDAMTVRPVRPGDPPVHRAAVIDGALVERMGAGERAIVFGLGHVARSVGPLLAKLGYEVIACDDGETGALGETPWAARVIESFDLREVERELGGLTRDDHVLIVTRDHAIDQQLLEQLIARDLGYLGMIGSRGKVGRFKKRLEAKGLYDEARWAALRAPIGLDIGAETPEEIAVAIAAELVALRRRGAASAGDWRGQTPLHYLSPLRPAAGRASASSEVVSDPRLVAVILAAGAGARLGGVAKALLPVDGQTFLARIVATAREVGLDDAVVVVGAPHGEAVAAHARELGLRVVENPAPERGMASSVALGFGALDAGDAAWLWPVDHPNVTAATLRALIAAFAGGVVQPRYAERGGHPPLVPRALWPALAACGDGGARAVFATADVVPVAVDDPGVVRDVDTPADARAL